MRGYELTEAYLDYIEAEMAYTVKRPGDARVRIFPPASGIKMESPETHRVSVRVFDCRPIIDELDLDIVGFDVATAPTTFRDFYDPDSVRADYYAESAALLKRHVGARAVFVFDHNVRNKTRAKRHEHGVGFPTDGAHNDYTLKSGPSRIAEVLEDNGALELLDRRASIINIWRPIRGPVQDQPLAICDARSTCLEDFIATRIEHYAEGDLQVPSHTGEIYSFAHSERHKWFYVPNMQREEVLFLKCYDTATHGPVCFTGHTGFHNPTCPDDFLPRESIELRTVGVYPESRTP